MPWRAKGRDTVTTCQKMTYTLLQGKAFRGKEPLLQKPTWQPRPPDHEATTEQGSLTTAPIASTGHL